MVKSRGLCVCVSIYIYRQQKKGTLCLNSNWFSKICDLFSALKVENTEKSITRKFFQMDHVSWRTWPLQLINVCRYKPLIFSVLLTTVILTSVLYIAVKLADSLMAYRQPDLEKKCSRSPVSICSWFSLGLLLCVSDTHTPLCKRWDFSCLLFWLTALPEGRKSTLWENVFSVKED